MALLLEESAVDCQLLPKLRPHKKLGLASEPEKTKTWSPLVDKEKVPEEVVKLSLNSTSPAGTSPENCKIPSPLRRLPSSRTPLSVT